MSHSKQEDKARTIGQRNKLSVRFMSRSLHKRKQTKKRNKLNKKEKKREIFWPSPLSLNVVLFKKGEMSAGPHELRQTVSGA